MLKALAENKEKLREDDKLQRMIQEQLHQINKENMETTAKVLDTMRSAGKPVSAGEVATLSGLDRKEVDKAFAQLKKDGAIVSPVRCKWQPAE